MKRHSFKKKGKTGFTLIEILVVISILAMLVLAVIFSLRMQRTRAEDVRVKTELERLKIAFEDYHTDNNCYPPAEWFDGPEDCGSANMQPYLHEITCDRHTGLPYVLEKDATGCGWFKLFGTLDLPQIDPQALVLCSPTGSHNGNYGVSSSNVTVQTYCGTSGSPIASASVSPTASPSPQPSGSLPIVDPTFTYYCQGANNCTSYDPYKFYCVPAHNDPNCGTGCTSASSCVLR